MITQVMFRDFIFLGVKRISEMFPTQNVLRCLPQRDQKNAWWNIGYTLLGAKGFKLCVWCEWSE